VKREHWKSKLGFMWAAIGSAVGLGSIWRFPYVVGENGGAVFVLLFCLFLLLVSLPILLSEIVIGRATESNPSDAFKKLGKNRFWKGVGTLQVITGLLVSVFYSVVCSWTLGYLLEAFNGNLSYFTTPLAAQIFWKSCLESVTWTMGCQIGFVFLSAAILYVGVQKGIESTNKILMPLLFMFLLFLAVVGIQMPSSSKGLLFLFSPNWSALNGKMVLLALGQAFFALSVGQGTMITYGSYLRKQDNLFAISLPVASSIVIVSLLAGIAIFTVIFSLGGNPSSGSELIFETLPLLFSKMEFGGFIAILFFSLIFFAGLTSQISAMEPFIAYLTDHKKYSRHKAVSICSLIVLVLGLPVGLSFGPLSDSTFLGLNLFEALSFFCINILIPLGALGAVLLLGWKNPFDDFLKALQQGTSQTLIKNPLFRWGFALTVRYLAPFVIFILLLNLFYVK